MKARFITMAILMAFVIAASTAAAGPQEDVVERDAAAIFDRVMSPYCPGRTLATCGSGAAEQLRQQITGDLRRGLAPNEVEGALYHRFGNSIRAVPETHGIGLIAWVVPPVLLFAGGVWLVAWLRGHTRSTLGPEADASPAPPQALLDRLDDELAQL